MRALGGGFERFPFVSDGPVGLSWASPCDIAISRYDCDISDEQGGGRRRRKPPTSKVPIDFGDELYDWLREAAFRKRGTMAELVREAVRQYREREERQLNLPFNGGR